MNKVWRFVLKMPFKLESFNIFHKSSFLYLKTINFASRLHFLFPKALIFIKIRVFLFKKVMLVIKFQDLVIEWWIWHFNIKSLHFKKKVCIFISRDFLLIISYALFIYYVYKLSLHLCSKIFPLILKSIFS